MKRLTRILDEAGKECALIDSRWIVVDTDRECILRQPSWHTPGYWNEDLDGELPQLVHKAKELTCAGSRTASYSHLGAGFLKLLCVGRSGYARYSVFEVGQAAAFPIN